MIERKRDEVTERETKRDIWIDRMTDRETNS